MASYARLSSMFTTIIKVFDIFLISISTKTFNSDDDILSLIDSIIAVSMSNRLSSQCSSIIGHPPIPLRIDLIICKSLALLAFLSPYKEH